MKKLMAFQRRHLDTLESNIRTYRAQRPKTSPYIELIAPTGSGKTLMLSYIIRDSLADSVVLFMSPGNGSLDDQTRRAIADNLAGQPFTVNDVTMETFRTPGTPGTILVKNWEAFCMRDKKTNDYKNLLVRDNEQGNLFSWLRETVKSGVNVVIMVDEAHYGKANAASKINDFLNDVKGLILEVGGAAPIVIEATATPIHNDIGPYHCSEVISFAEARDAGLLRSFIDMNHGVSMLGDSVENMGNEDAETYLLDKAYAMQNELIAYYHEAGDDVTPLIGIQLSNGKPSVDALDRITKYWAGKGITEANGQLFVYMNTQKSGQIASLESPTSNVRVLIYKQAIAMGWNCPRAQILVGFRHTKSKVFEIQNLGRFLRTTNGRHYTNTDTKHYLELNGTYIYSNDHNLDIEHDLNGLQATQGITAIQRLRVPDEYDRYIDEYNRHRFPTSYSKRIVRVNRKRDVVTALAHAVESTGFAVRAVTESRQSLASGITDVSVLDDRSASLHAEDTGTIVRAGDTEIDDDYRSLLASTLRASHRMNDVVATADRLGSRLLMRPEVEQAERGSAADRRRLLVHPDNRQAVIDLVKAFADDRVFDPVNDDEPVSTSQSRLSLTGAHSLPKHMLVNRNCAPLGDYMVSHALYRDAADEHVAYRIDPATPSSPERDFERMVIGGLHDHELVALQKLPSAHSEITFSLGIHLMVSYSEGGEAKRANFFPDYHLFVRSLDTGAVKPVLVEIKGSTAYDSPALLAAKAAAADQYTKNTGLPFIVLQETGPGTGEFYKYGEPGIDLNAFLTAHEHDEMRVFDDCGVTENIPDDLKWMEKLGGADIR
jgi:superfamily II DNA or RNA helicase